MTLKSSLTRQLLIGVGLLALVSLSGHYVVARAVGSLSGVLSASGGPALSSSFDSLKMALWVGWFAQLVLVGLGSGLVFWLVRSLRVKGDRLAQSIHRLVVGDLETEIPIVPADELSSVTEALRQLQNSQRNWVKSVQEIAAGNLSNPALASPALDAPSQALDYLLEHLRERLEPACQSVHQLRASTEQLQSVTNFWESGVVQATLAARESAQAAEETASAVREVALAAQVQACEAHRARQLCEGLAHIFQQISETTEQQSEHIGTARSLLACTQEAQLEITRRVDRLMTQIPAPVTWIETEDALIGTMEAYLEHLQGQMAEVVKQLAQLGQRALALGEMVDAIEQVAALSNRIAQQAALSARTDDSRASLILLAEEMRPLVTQSRHTAHALIGHVTGIQDDTQQIMATIQNIRLQTVESVQYTNQLRAALQTLQRQTNTHIQEAQGVAEVVQDTQLATEALQPALDQIAAGTYAVYLAANRARCEGEFLTDTLQGIGDTAQQTEVAISRLAVVQQQIAEFTSLLAEGVPEQKQKLQQISETAQNLTGQTHALVGHLEPFQRVATQENTLPARKTA